MSWRPKWATVTIALALIAALAIAAPGFGVSIKRLVKKEVAKQLAHKQGPPGPAGASGADFTASSTLRPGETLTGVWAIAGGVSASAPDAIPFAPQLPTSLSAGAVHRLAPSTTSADCPGPGLAAAGNLCVYERASANAAFNTIADPATGDNGANRRGAVIEYTTSASNGYADGTWAVTP